jgi:hypothetical protein
MRETVLSFIFMLSVLLGPSVAHGESPEGSTEKRLSGMAIVGNDEAPKSLVIVPWKSSELGDTLEVSRALDDGRQPVDRDVFGRALAYYRIRSGWNDGRGAAAK